MAEVMLRELARQPFEPYDGRGTGWPHTGYERVERRLVAFVAVVLRATQQLLCREVAIFSQPREHLRRKGRRLRRSTDAPSSMLRNIVGLGDLVLEPHTLHGVDRHANTLRDVRLSVAGAEQNLDLVSSEQGKHLPRLHHPARHLSCFHHAPSFREAADFPERRTADFPEPSVRPSGIRKFAARIPAPASP